jgi:hypothetical protein
MLKTEKIRLFVWHILLLLMLAAGIVFLDPVEETGTPVNYEGAVFAQTIQQENGKELWIQS